MFDQAMDEIWIIVRSLNQYIGDPALAGLLKNRDKDRLSEILAHACGTLLPVSDN